MVDTSAPLITVLARRSRIEVIHSRNHAGSKIRSGIELGCDQLRGRMDQGGWNPVLGEGLTRAYSRGIHGRGEGIENRNAAGEITFQLTVGRHQRAGVSRPANPNALVVAEHVPTPLAWKNLRDGERPARRRAELVPSERTQ